MGANTNNWDDVSRWIKRVIESCTTSEQCDAAERLILNYEKEYEEKVNPLLLFDEKLQLFSYLLAKRKSL